MTIENKKAYFEYDIKDTLEAGMVLEGWEVKAIAHNQFQIEGSYVKIMNDQAVLVGSTVQVSQEGVDKQRTRTLLLNRSEINKLTGLVKQDGYTLVPLKVYKLRNKYKLLVGVAKGKNLHDKRQTQRNKDADKEARRAVKNQMY